MSLFDSAAVYTVASNTCSFFTNRGANISKINKVIISHDDDKHDDIDDEQYVRT